MVFFVFVAIEGMRIFDMYLHILCISCVYDIDITDISQFVYIIWTDRYTPTRLGTNSPEQSAVASPKAGTKQQGAALCCSFGVCASRQPWTPGSFTVSHDFLLILTIKHQ